VPPIAAPTVQDPNDRDVTTAAPPSSADPLHAQLSRKEGKSARARGKNNLRRSSVNDGSPAAPTASSRSATTHVRQRILGLVAMSEPCRLVERNLCWRSNPMLRFKV